MSQDIQQYVCCDYDNTEIYTHERVRLWHVYADALWISLLSCFLLELST